MHSSDSKTLSGDWRQRGKKTHFRKDGHNRGEEPTKKLKKWEDSRRSNSKTGKNKKKWRNEKTLLRRRKCRFK
jgi:hypothetical protein